MNFMELAKARYSLRSFDRKKVEKEKLNLILQAGQTAPTACNFQPQRILVIESRDALNKLKDCTPYAFDAPITLLVCADTDISWKRKYDNKDHADIDASIVALHMMLQATELGLGTTWVGHFDPAAIRKAFSIPKNITPVCLLPLGYPGKTAQIDPNHYKRKDLNETVFYNNF